MSCLTNRSRITIIVVFLCAFNFYLPIWECDAEDSKGYTNVVGTAEIWTKRFQQILPASWTVKVRGGAVPFHRVQSLRPGIFLHGDILCGGHEREFFPRRCAVHRHILILGAI